MRALLKMVSVAACLAAAVAQPAVAADKSVKVTAIVEHPALDATRDGIRDELAAQGFTVGAGLSWEYQSAQGDVGTAGQIARKFVGAAPDVIVAIATPSAQAVAAASRGSVPVVFSAVTDPVAARLVPSWDHPGAVTGVSDALPLADHLALIKEAVPSLRKLGVLFNPGEVNSVSTVTELRKLAAAAGIVLVEAPAPDTTSVLAAARALVGRADAVFVPTDNTVVSAFEAVVKVGRDGKLPVFAADTGSVPRGAVAALGFDYYHVGRQTGRIVADILRGGKTADIPVRGVEVRELWLNPASAQAMGLSLPEAMVRRAAKVVK